MKRLLVALDRSPRARIVLHAARRLAELTGSKLLLYHAVVVPPELPPEVLAGEDLESLLLRDARAQLATLADLVPAPLVEKTVVQPATAWDGICRTAREEEADLIVIGSHGFGGIDRLIGTTAARVVNHTDRNVLVVRTLL